MKLAPKHGRALVIGGVSLTKARLGKSWGQILDELRNTFEARLIEMDYFAKAPFAWITLIIRYGLVDSPVPNLMKLSKRRGVLDLSIEIDVSQILGVSDQVVRRIFSAAIVRALNGARSKYEVLEILDVYGIEEP